MQINKNPLGYEVITDNFTVLLGGVQSQLPQLKEFYPALQFARVKQIHSDVVVNTPDASVDFQITADAHFSNQKNLALCIATADCVPVFFYDPENSTVAAVHAGWRGVASNILQKTVHALEKQGGFAKNLTVIIGPHIQMQSFEVGNDVRDNILQSLGSLSDSEKEIYFQPTAGQKSYLDLNLVVRSQLQLAGIEFDHLFNLHIDTVTSTEFHSYRRDKEKSGRQISFICRNR